MCGIFTMKVRRLGLTSEVETQVRERFATETGMLVVEQGSHTLPFPRPMNLRLHLIHASVAVSCRRLDRFTP